jgi:hypothetical protein
MSFKLGAVVLPPDSVIAEVSILSESTPGITLGLTSNNDDDDFEDTMLPNNFALLRDLDKRFFVDSAACTMCANET